MYHIINFLKMADEIIKHKSKFAVRSLVIFSSFKCLILVCFPTEIESHAMRLISHLHCAYFGVEL